MGAARRGGRRRWWQAGLALGVVVGVAIAVPVVSGAAGRQQRRRPTLASLARQVSALRAEDRALRRRIGTVVGLPGPQGPAGPQGIPGETTPTLPSGRTLRGEFLLDESDLSAGSTIGATISFGGYSLPTPPTLGAVDRNGPPTVSCPGTSRQPEAAPGTLCFYVTNRANVRTTSPYDLGPGFTSEDATTGTDGQTDRFGTQLYAQIVSAGRGYVEGTWAVTAP